MFILVLKCIKIGSGSDILTDGGYHIRCTDVKWEDRKKAFGGVRNIKNKLINLEAEYTY